MKIVKNKEKEEEMERVRGGATEGGEGSSGRADLGTGYRPPETNTISWPMIIPLDDVFVLVFILFFFACLFCPVLFCCSA